LTNGHAYSFKVAARNAIGTGAAAKSGSIIVGAPGPPQKGSVGTQVTNYRGGLTVWAGFANKNGSTITRYTGPVRRRTVGQPGARSTRAAAGPAPSSSSRVPRPARPIGASSPRRTLAARVPGQPCLRQLLRPDCRTRGPYVVATHARG
jgi:hypothetical protein